MAGQEGFLGRFGADGTRLWTRTYYPSNERSIILSVLTAPDAGFLLGAAYNPNCCGSFQRPRLMRTDSNGDPIWTLLGAARGSFFALAPTQDGHYLAAGTFRIAQSDPANLYLLKFTIDGDTLWSRVHAAAVPFFPGDMIATSDGGFLITVPNVIGGLGRGYVVKVTSTGDVEWSRRIDGPFSINLHFAAQGQDGEFLVVGSYQEAAGPGTHVGYYVKLSSSGDTLWTRRAGAPVWGVCRDPAGGFFVMTTADNPGTGTDLLVRRLADDGTTIWERAHGGPGEEFEGWRIRATADGGFVTGGAQSPGSGCASELYLVRGAVTPARFSGSPLRGPLPLLVQFTDESSGAPTGWEWDFDGDGGTDATTPSPSHGFGEFGPHSVRLITSYGATRDTLTRVAYVAPFRYATARSDSFAGAASSAWGDYDGDGNTDLYVSADTTGRLLRNVAGSFTDVTTWPLTGGGTGKDAAWADFDNDGDLDLYIANRSAPSRLLRNDGASFVDLASGELGSPGGVDDTRGCAWADYDRDGDVDLFVSVFDGSSRLFRNDSTLGLVLATPQPAVGGPSRGAAWADVDGDGDPDLYAVHEGAANQLFRNDGNGSFVDVTSGPLGDAGPGAVAAFGDYDGDADLDLYLGCTDATSKLIRNDLDSWVDVTNPVLAPVDGVTGAAWGDADNDGDLDLFLHGSTQARLLINEQGSFSEEPLPCGRAGQGGGVALADYDRDGDLDASFTTSTASLLARNEMGGGAHWLQVALTASRSNRSAIGARVTVVAGGERQIRETTGGGSSQDELVPHFGLGGATSAESLIVRWPSGVMQVLAPVAADQRVQVVEPGLVYSDTLEIVSTTITSASPTGVPVVHHGATPLGVVSMYFVYDASRLIFGGVQSRVAGETFSSGIVNGKISVQWFDETAGADPIQPSEDTLFVLLFTPQSTAEDSTTIRVDRTTSALGDQNGDPIPYVFWRDQPPHGRVLIDIPINVMGRVGYYWQDKHVPGAHLGLGAPVADVFSDGSGAYLFADVPAGNYTLSITKADDLDGSNSLDALKVVRHASNTEPLGNSFKEMAADVTANGQINAFDAFRIVQAAVGATTLPSGDWKFAPVSRSYAPLVQSQSGQDFTAIRMGDVNGDWQPTGGSLVLQPEMASRSGPGGVTVALPDTSLDPSVTALDTRLYVTGFDNVGAISLRVTFTDSVLTYGSLTSNVSGVTFTSNRVGNEVRIEWFDPNGGASPITMDSGNLLTMHWSVIGAPSDTAHLHFRAADVGGPTGDPLQVTAVDGRCILSSAPTGIETGVARGFALDSAQPNPFTARTQIRFVLDREGPTRLEVFDVQGHLVRVLFEGWKEPGAHLLSWDGRSAGGRRLGPGLYFVRLQAGDRTLRGKVALVR